MAQVQALALVRLEGLVSLREPELALRALELPEALVRLEGLVLPEQGLPEEGLAAGDPRRLA